MKVRGHGRHGAAIMPGLDSSRFIIEARPDLLREEVTARMCPRCGADNSIILEEIRRRDR
jgi:hypothetical protein